MFRTIFPHAFLDSLDYFWYRKNLKLLSCFRYRFVQMIEDGSNRVRINFSINPFNDNFVSRQSFLCFFGLSRLFLTSKKPETLAAFSP